MKHSRACEGIIWGGTCTKEFCDCGYGQDNLVEDTVSINKMNISSLLVRLHSAEQRINELEEHIRELYKDAKLS